MKKLPTDYQNYIHQSRYARWLDEEKRRETWEETVTRYIKYFSKRLPELSEVESEVFDAILNLDVMPSMRCMMTAGPALERDNVAGYNCSYLAIDHPRCFDELMYVLLCGTGVGFSVERQYINQLPEVPDELHETESVIVVSDSKIGWASAYRELIAILYAGKIPQWDLSRIRPAGARLKTFGGRASGPAPLDDLFTFTRELFLGAKGRKFNSLEVHDLVCKIADIVVVGGVRRSALISLSNLTDERMRGAKSGQWWAENSQRALANNSVCYTEHPDLGIFLKEWSSLYESKSGERGIFNRSAAKQTAARNGRRDTEWDFGTNPCSEIILRPGQFCNLTEVVIRPHDDLSNLKRKVQIATILGTMQSTLTDFRYLRRHWKRNTEEERLLGVSLTGIMDHKVMSGGVWNPAEKGGVVSLEQTLNVLREVAIETNKEWAAKLGIEQSAAITCVKPSGTVSQLVNSASGIHARFSDYYIRTVRADNNDPLTKFLIEQGVPYEPAIGKESSTTVFSFPQSKPTNNLDDEAVSARTTKDAVWGNTKSPERSALEQLSLWSIYSEHWCEHKPSITVYYRDTEFLDCGAWVYKNFEKVSGVSFLPKSDHIYKQAPYQEITKDEYEAAIKAFPKIDWEAFGSYEMEDSTTATHELACVAGACEI